MRGRVDTEAKASKSFGRESLSCTDFLGSQRNPATIEAIAGSTSHGLLIPSDEAKDFPPVDTHERATSGQGVQVSGVDRHGVLGHRGGQAQIRLTKLNHTLRWVEFLMYQDFSDPIAIFGVWNVGQCLTGSHDCQ